MNYLPREVERPRVIKASATDIPVFCLNLTLKSDSAYSEINEGSFLDLCQFAETVIKRRIEQLPEVAMVDVTGILKRQLQIVPDMKLLKMSEITLDDLEAALTSNNIEPGSMTRHVTAITSTISSSRHCCAHRKMSRIFISGKITIFFN